MIGAMTRPQSAMLTVRVPLKLKTALERAAGRDHRTLSSLVLKVLTEWTDTQKQSDRR